ncbi:hypothetical protein [Haloarcula brevis]
MHSERGQAKADQPIERHLREAYEHAEDDEVLYHLREALQILYGRQD